MITLVLPWAHIAADNNRLMPILLGKRTGMIGKCDECGHDSGARCPTARLATEPKYRDAKEAATADLRAQWIGPRIDGSVAIIGVLFFPNKIRRDAGNYRKLITDALTGVAYLDDSQLLREVWDFGGYDKANPRVEIRVVPFIPAHVHEVQEVLSLFEVGA